MKYDSYQKLKFDWPSPRVLEITLIGSGRANALDAIAHSELAQVWKDIDADPDVSSVVVRGSETAFAAGGHVSGIEDMGRDFALLLKGWKEASGIVYNIMNCSRPIVSAIRGPCAGAGLAVALMSDISIAARNATIIDSHTKIGVPAGDHAAIIWPLLCGMAKAKYYLLLNEKMSGEEAERIGLVSMCVDEAEVYDKARSMAKRLSEMAPNALRLTKYSLNHWLRAAGPIFDTSSVLESMCFMGDEAREGIAAFLEKRAPVFNQNSPI